jgi:hypothetical protein
MEEQARPIAKHVSMHIVTSPELGLEQVAECEPELEVSPSAQTLRRQGSFAVCPAFRRLQRCTRMGKTVPDQYASVAMWPLLYWACELLARLVHAGATLIFWLWGWRVAGAAWQLKAVAVAHAAIILAEIPIFHMVGPVQYCQRIIAWPFLGSHMTLFSIITLYPLFQVRGPTLSAVHVHAGWQRLCGLPDLVSVCKQLCFICPRIADLSALARLWQSKQW